MTLNVNGTEMSLVNLNGARMEAVNINGTNVYNAANGNVTMIYTGTENGTFDPGVEDVNRHFVVVGVRFSGDGLGNAATPTINGTSMTLITRGNSSFGDDGGITGIFTIKIPTGTGTFTVAQGSTAFNYIAIYRVTGIFEMTTDTVLSSQSTRPTITGEKTSSANGCFFGASVTNFGLPSFPSPNSTGLTYTAPSNQGRIAASNVTTGPTQTVSLNGSQINSFAIFQWLIVAGVFNVK
jgi:hypothetical protein